MAIRHFSQFFNHFLNLRIKFFHLGMLTVDESVLIIPLIRANENLCWKIFSLTILVSHYFNSGFTFFISILFLVENLDKSYFHSILFLCYILVMPRQRWYQMVTQIIKNKSWLKKLKPLFSGALTFIKQWQLLSCQGSNLNSSEPKSDVLPITPQDNFPCFKGLQK